MYCKHMEMDDYLAEERHDGPAFEDLRQVMALLSRTLNIVVTFFDVQERELEDLNVRGMSDLCRCRRLDRDFDNACRDCDHQHLEVAKQAREIQIYHCHGGLVEGIVPLYDRTDLYLGAIVFGQLRDPDHDITAELHSSFLKDYLLLPKCTLEEARDIGGLLKLVSEYIIQQELIRIQHKPWVDKVKDYIEDHLTEKITLSMLARLIGRSSYFVSRHFESEFGTTAKKYILSRKMMRAKEMLRSGAQVKEVATELGFYDAFHFSKQFKSFWGKSPSAFKPES